MRRWLTVAAVFGTAGAGAQLDGSLISLEDPAIGYRSEPLGKPVPTSRDVSRKARRSSLSTLVPVLATCPRCSASWACR